MKADPDPSRDRAGKSAEAQRVTLIGMLLDVALGTLKIIIGTLAHSYALIADGIHSFTDAASDIMVVLITRLSHQAPDREHPYGHGKFETLGTVVLGCMLIAVAGAMAYDSLTRLISGKADVAPGWPAILAAALSIAGKEWIYRYTLKVGERLHSDLIIANAWHSRTDALSSVVVLIALIGAMTGYPWLDALAAVVVAGFVGKIGWGLAWNSIKELVETSLPQQELKRIRELVLQVEGVRDSDFLRGRYVGPDIVLDVHLEVDPTISVSEGHHIGLCVGAVLQTEIDRLSDITFHIDAEEDESVERQLATVKRLPQRHELTKILLDRWRGVLSREAIQKFQLHYLRENIYIEIMLKDLPDADLRGLRGQLLERVQDLEWIGSLRVWKSVE